MILFKNIREKLGKSSITKKLSKDNRKPKIKNYTEAQSVGIIYKIKDKDYQYFINNFIDYLREDVGFKVIKTLGFYEEKVAPTFLDLGSKYQFINQKDLNWNFTPKKESVDQFTSSNFDLLIDLTDEYCIPLRHTVVHTAASLKIGRYNEEEIDFYDFMINLPEHASLKEFTNQLNHYLSSINKT